jgi:anaerobic selenocysteine-containing dehydrogenase
LRKAWKEPRADIHTDTAKQYGISNGDWMWIETLRGRIRQKARVTNGIQPRTIAIEFGWWFPEDGGTEYGIYKSNANMLTNDAPPYDPAMGTYQLRALLCRVSKSENGINPTESNH